MTKLYNRESNTLPTCISLCLAVCLIFSSLSAYTFEIFFNDNTNQTIFSKTQLEEGYVHHTIISKNEFLAELIDIEEEDENSHKKNSNITFAKVLRTLWSYSFVEADNLYAIEHVVVPVIKIAEPCYIEYCSLKIPS